MRRTFWYYFVYFNTLWWVFNFLFFTRSKSEGSFFCSLSIFYRALFRKFYIGCVWGSELIDFQKIFQNLKCIGYNFKYLDWILFILSSVEISWLIVWRNGSEWVAGEYRILLPCVLSWAYWQVNRYFGLL